MEITSTVEQQALQHETEKQDAVDTSPGDSAKTYVPFENVNTTDTSLVKEGDPVVGAAADGTRINNEVIEPDDAAVEITDSDKLAFIRALTSGKRFEETVYLFGGNVKVKFRSRSVEETEAILAYMHKAGMDGKFTTKADVSDTSLAILLVAQVAELDATEYGEMKKPLKYTEDSDGIHEPGWLKDVDMWKKKPEMLVAALGDALVSFESKYWTMVGASRNENFWNPGGSTGK